MDPSTSTSPFVPRLSTLLPLARAAQCASGPLAAAQAKEVPFGSLKYYSLCGAGGALCCGLTHVWILPLDIVKCRMQIDPAKYPSILSGFRTTVADEGARGLVKGWFPTAAGYSMQGFGKFGFYEGFKVLYANLVGDEIAYQYRTALYLVAAASAEACADLPLAPFEAAKVRMQTTVGHPRTFRECAPLIYRNEGAHGFFKGLPPLWGRQVPYTMVKFACFERTIEALYRHVVPKPKADCSKAEQLAITFAAGYIAGIACAIASHPADVVVSALNGKDAAGKGFVEVAKQLGFRRLWAGLAPRIIMIGTISALQWFIYDGFKVAMHLPRPPPPAMPESLRKKMEKIGK
ncbi:hypothetical protein PRIPAC_78390 [Pristionchus pacificus]|uniref:Phosphate carrier protein, mitochondrial n=1 Tax=Pristionchus pacificus TaxID=54126 RepID=A0A2A6BW66_PRIPA|nr:hypothetical protein PRIPAC_78390 [Pristionchus pacificus]|eukprot:PDM70011.1 mitochondrial carrier protein [Pristionchus pacificus]